MTTNDTPPGGKRPFLGDDDVTPARPVRIPSSRSLVLADLALVLHAIALNCTEAARVIDHLGPIERTRCALDISQRLGQLATLANEAQVNIDKEDP